MRKQAALILTMIAIVVLLVTLNSGKVYAAPVLTIIPSPVTQGGNVMVTGSGLPSSQTGFVIVFADNTGLCSGSHFANSPASTDGSGNLGAVTISTSGLSVGTHCVVTEGFFISFLVPENAVSSFTVNPPPPIPEYPMGLPLLAILAVIGYGVIKRRTRN